MDNIYQEYLSSKGLPYFEYLVKEFNHKIANEMRRFLEAKNWDEVCAIRGKIDGLKLALAVMEVKKPEE